MDTDFLSQLQAEASQDPEKADRLRAMVYEKLSGDPNHPKAALLRQVLGALPKVKVGRREPIRGGLGVHGELSGGDIGSELPPTEDESLGIEGSGMQEIPLLHRVAANAGNLRGRRAFVRGVDDMVTLGAAGRIAERNPGIAGMNELSTAIEGVGKAFPELGDRASALADEARAVNYSEKQAAKDDVEYPYARPAGQIAGAAVPFGGASLIGRAGLGIGARAATELGGGVVRRGIGGAVGGSLAPPAIAAGQAAIRGEDPRGALREQLTNPYNYLLSGGFGAAGGMARGIRDSAGHTGRDIRLVESYGAKPTPFSGAKGGAFDSPLLSEAGTAGEQGMASRRAAEKVMGSFDDESLALSRSYRESKASARAQGFLEGLIDTETIRQDANKLISGLRLTSSQRAAIQREVLDELDKFPGGMPLDDFNDLRAKLGDIFGTGPGEAAHPALDTLRQSAKRTVDDTEMGPINEAYHKGREAISRKHSQLGIAEGGRREVAEKQIANLIQRRANDEAAGAGIQEAGDLGTSQFLKENPRFKPAFDTARLLAAKERMSFGAEPQAAFHRRMGHHLLEKNLEPAAVALYRMGVPLERLGVPATVAAQYFMQGGQ